MHTASVGACTVSTTHVSTADQTPPPLTSIDSLASTITLKWSGQPCTVRYSVSWMYTNDDGTTTTDSGVTELTNYTIPTSVGGVYTVSVEAVGVGNVGPSTTEVVRSSECLVLYPDPQPATIFICPYKNGSRLHEGLCTRMVSTHSTLCI